MKIEMLCYIMKYGKIFKYLYCNVLRLNVIMLIKCGIYLFLVNVKFMFRCFVEVNRCDWLGFMKKVV